VTDDRTFHPPGRLTVPEILAATGGRLAMGRSDGDWSFCTDSRQMDDGALFVALRGDKHDGHDWVARTLGAHRAGALVEEVPQDLDGAVGGPVIVVPDTLVAFGDVAAAFLRKQGPAVAAITGSVGKTTTRAMLAAILEALGPGLCTAGNFNNRIGLPLTLLRLRPEHRWAVLEMGMSEPGEIRELARLARPRVRVITWVSAGHLEFFDSVQGIADAKGELFEAARPGDTLVFPHKAWFSPRFPRPAGALEASFGHGGADVFAEKIQQLGLEGMGFVLRIGDERADARLPLVGQHQVHNATAAAAAARAMGASVEQIVAGLGSASLPGRRMRVEQIGGITVVDDAYNANPASVEAALHAVSSIEREGRLAVALGDMLELGDTADQLHGELGNLAVMLGVDLLVGAGPLAAAAVAAFEDFGKTGHAVADSAEAGRLLADWLKPGDLLLVKGSRGMRMEAVLDAIRPAEGN
jgi:UDP-N-acetylmuramoyl-tripeptide--D-alanyl-D-alanine ligase